MNTKLAYEAICSAVLKDQRRCLIDHRFEEQHFGNFMVAFTENGRKRSVINDRGFVFVTGDLGGTGRAIAAVASLEKADAETLFLELRL